MDTRDFISTAGRIGKLAAIFAIGAVGGALLLAAALGTSLSFRPYWLPATAAYLAGLGIWFAWAVVRGVRSGVWLSGNSRIDPVWRILNMLNRKFPRGMRVVELAMIFGFFAIGATLLVASISLLIPFPGGFLPKILVGVPVFAALGFCWASIRGLRGKGWVHLNGREQSRWADCSDLSDDLWLPARRMVDLDESIGIHSITGRLTLGSVNGVGGIDTSGNPDGVRWHD